MKTVIIIPARYASSRYPGKPLVELKGATGEAKSLIRRSWDAAMEVKGVDAVYVATDDDRIKEAAESFGAKVVMTSENCQNGTERCADALKNIPETPDLVVNLQGDAPLTPPEFVEAMIKGMRDDPDAAVTTPGLRCDAEAYHSFIEDRHAGRVGGTTVVFNAYHDALYFSKEVIPYTGKTYTQNETLPVFHHVGLYAYRPAALQTYMSLPTGPLETLEGLEQLRFLENRIPVRVVEVDANGRVFWELNNPVDVERVESALKRMGVA